MQILQKIFESGIKLFLVEHNMDVVMNLCHKITVLSFGVKIAERMKKTAERFGC